MFGTASAVNIKSKIWLWPLLALTVFSSCRRHTRDGRECRPLVRVGERLLCREDIPPHIYRGRHGQDSVLAVNRYKDDWVTAQTFLYYAARNVDTAKINRLTEDYRNSLLRDFYENELRAALTDTIRVNEEELRDFYARHKQNFKAEDTLIRWRYLIMPQDYKERYKVIRWFNDGSQEAKEKIEERYKNLLAVKLDSGAWVPYEQARKMMPFLHLQKPYGRKHPYRIRKVTESRVYLVDIFEAVYPGDILPYEYIKPRLRHFLKQKKWKNSLQILKQKMRKEAEKHKIIEYVDK